MRSGTSFFDRTVFQKTVLRFWPIWASYLVFWLLALPLSGTAMIRWAPPSQDYDSMVRSLAAWPATMEPVVLATSVFFGVIAAMAVFSHLYSARSANFFGALPVRREGLFLTLYLAGLSFLIVPNLITALLYLFVSMGEPAVLTALGYWLLCACADGFFFYTFAVFCGMFAGHILALPAFYAIFNALFAALYYMLEVVMREFYYGFDIMDRRAYELARWFTPVSKLGQVDVMVTSVLEPVSELSSTLTDTGKFTVELYHGEALAVYAAAALAMAVVSFLLYRARRLESAGDVVAVRPMRPVFKYSVSFCAGVFIGTVTAAVLGGSKPVWMASILFWAVAGCFVAQMILDKSFRVFKKWRGPVVMAGVFCALFAVIAFDLTGYVTRVPGAAAVKSVHVNGLHIVNLGDGGDWMDLDIEDPDQIEVLIGLHQAAVDQRDLDFTGSSAFGTWLDLDYTLKDGSTMSRSYNLNLFPDEVDREGSAAWLVQQLYNDRKLTWRAYGFDKLEEELAQGLRLDSVDFYHYDDMGGSGVFAAGYGSDARTLLDAVEEDLMAGRIGVRVIHERATESRSRTDNLIFRVANTANTTRKYNSYSSSYPMDYPMEWYRINVEIALQDTASSTLAVLNELAEHAYGERGESFRNALKGWGR